MLEENPLLLTKTRLPSPRSTAVPRSRLVAQLTAATKELRLLLVSAPAGFGKTTFLSELAHTLKDRSGCFIAWYSLDETDNTLTRFMLYLLKSLSDALTGDVDLRPVSRLLQSNTDGSMDAALVNLLNILTELPRPCMLVLDDYHIISAPAVHSAVNFLLEHAPPQLCMVIGSRSDPPLPLSRLRARGQMLEIRSGDLKFTAEEANDFLQPVVGQALTTEELGVVEHFSEGWAAGLQLLAIGLRQQKGASTRKIDVVEYIRQLTERRGSIDDYLAEEVFAALDPDLQSFLLETSVLDGLNPDICAAVTGRTDAAHILEQLYHSNLFVVSLEGQDFWYRYHNLFGQFLRQRLERYHPERLAMLYRRAMEWFQSRGLHDEAIRYARAARDFSAAADLVEEVVERAWRSGEMALLRDWLSNLPEDVLLSRPLLSIYQGFQHVVGARHDAARTYLEVAESLLTDNCQLANGRLHELKGIATAIRAMIDANLGHSQKAIDYAEQALGLLPEDNLVWRTIATIALGVAYGLGGQLVEMDQSLAGLLQQPLPIGNSELSIFVYKNLALLQATRGDHQLALQTCLQALEFARKESAELLPDVATIHSCVSGILYEQNDLTEAERHAGLGLRLAGYHGSTATSIICHAVLANVWQARGDATKARELMDSLSAAVGQRKVKRYLDQALAYSAWLALRQGRTADAIAWANRFLSAGELEFTYRTDEKTLILVRILMADDQAESALQILQHLADTAQGRYKAQVGVRLLSALGLYSLSQTEAALEQLEQAVDLAVPQHLLRSFLDEGPVLLPLLRLLLPRSLHPEFVNTLLVFHHKQLQAAAELEVLSNRELDVLRLVASGASNQELADALSISISTVKVHINHILSKLAVKNRTEAVARARELGII